MLRSHLLGPARGIFWPCVDSSVRVSHGSKSGCDWWFQRSARVRVKCICARGPCCAVLLSLPLSVRRGSGADSRFPLIFVAWGPRLSCWLLTAGDGAATSNEGLDEASATRATMAAESASRDRDRDIRYRSPAVGPLGASGERVSNRLVVAAQPHSRGFLFHSRVPQVSVCQTAWLLLRWPHSRGFFFFRSRVSSAPSCV